MLPVKNDLPESVRDQVIPLLQARLADGLDLLRHIKQAHWNVKGPNFIALHKLFDKVYEEIEEGADLVAERLVQLGGIAEGTSQSVAKRTSLPEYSLKLVDSKEHIEALSNSLAVYAKAVRKAIDQADEMKDAGTSDLFTQLSRDVDKNLWMVESHGILERREGGSKSVKGVA